MWPPPASPHSGRIVLAAPQPVPQSLQSRRGIRRPRFRTGNTNDRDRLVNLHLHLGFTRANLAVAHPQEHFPAGASELKLFPGLETQAKPFQSSLSHGE